MGHPEWDRQFAETQTERNARLREKRKLAAARREGVLEGLRLAEKCVPTNWLDPLLTGPDAVLKKGHDNREIEALLRGVQDRVRAEIAKLKGES